MKFLINIPDIASYRIYTNETNISDFADCSIS